MSPSREQSVWDWMRIGRLIIDVTLFLSILILLSYHKTTTQLAENGAYTNDISPFYSTSKIDLGPLYDKYIGKDGYSKPLIAWTTVMNKTFHAQMNCTHTPTQEMCICVEGATSWKTVHNCLLQNAVPLLMRPMYHLSMLSVVLLWFGFSTASSLMMYDDKSGSNAVQNTYVKPQYIRYVGVAVALLALIGSIVCGMAAGADATGFTTTQIILMLSTIIFVVAPHIDTIKILFTDDNTKQGNEMYYNITSSQQFVFYSLLVLAIPSVVTVLHITHHWYDVEMLMNSVFLLITIVCVDAFSMHLTTHWESNMIQLNHDTEISVGVIKMFAWMTNLVCVYLLVTINYPTIVDEPLLAYGLFAIMILFLLFTFILPDLVREFTHVYTMYALNFRRWGELMLRFVALVYITVHMHHHMILNGAPPEGQTLTK